LNGTEEEKSRTAHSRGLCQKGFEVWETDYVRKNKKAKEKKTKERKKEPKHRTRIGLRTAQAWGKEGEEWYASKMRSSRTACPTVSYRSEFRGSFRRG